MNGPAARSTLRAMANEEQDFDDTHRLPNRAERMTGPLEYASLHEAREKLVEARLRIRDAKEALCWIAERLQDTENDLSEEVYAVVRSLASVFPPPKAIWAENVSDDGQREQSA